MNWGPPVVEHAHRHQGHPFFWFLLLLVFLALIALAFYTLVRLARGGGTPAAAMGPAAPDGDAAIESVRMRYARGEIERDEFIRVSTDLGAPPPAPAV